MTAQTMTAIAQAHRLPVSMSDALRAERDDAVLVRYDGMTRGDDRIAFAVISLADMAKLPGDVLEGIEFLESDADGRLKGSRHAFMLETPNGGVLYVDTNRHPDFLVRVMDACEDAEISCLRAHGDLDLMTDPQGDFAPAARPAFLEIGFAPIPVRLGLDRIDALRAPAAKAEAPAFEGSSDAGRAYMSGPSFMKALGAALEKAEIEKAEKTGSEIIDDDPDMAPRF